MQCQQYFHDLQRMNALTQRPSFTQNHDDEESLSDKIQHYEYEWDKEVQRVQRICFVVPAQRIVPVPSPTEASV